MQETILDAQLQPEASNTQATFAPFNRRFGAVIIDAILVGFIVNLFEELDLSVSSNVAIYAIVNLGQSLYGPIMEALWGATFGKKWLDLMVVNKQFGKINMGQAILRNIIPLFSTLIGFVIGYMSGLYADLWLFEPRGNFNMSYAETGLIAFVVSLNFIDCLVYINDKKHRALHDIIAGTYVVTAASPIKQN